MKIFLTINDIPDAPMRWLSLPDSSLLKTDNPFFVPDFDTDFEARPVLAVRNDKLGKSISARFADRYYHEFAAGIVIVAKNLLKKLREEGAPWTAATGFDRSCIIGSFHPVSELEKHQDIMFSDNNGNGLAGKFPDREALGEALERISAYNTMKTGDIILLPADIGQLKLSVNSRIDISSHAQSLLNIKIK